MQYFFKAAAKASQMANQSLDSCFPNDCPDDGSVSDYNSSLTYNYMQTAAGRNPVRKFVTWLFYKMNDAVMQKRAKDLEKQGYRRF